MKFWELTSKAFSEQVLGKIDTVIIPLGTVEAHGMHCPLGTDDLIPENLAVAVEKLFDDKILVAPTVNYGHSWYLAVFPGGLDVSTETLAAYLTDIGKSFLRWQVTKIVFLNGHGGNAGALGIAAEKLADQGASVLTIHWWMDYRKEILAVTTGQGHAGEDETAAVLALRPDLVDMSAASRNFARSIGDVRVRDIALHTYPGALSGDATLATPEKGERILAAVAEAISRTIRAFQNGAYVER